MSHLERRRNLWYATLTIPKPVRAKFGKLKFVQSLGTADKHQAKLLAAPLVAKWKAMIRREQGDGDALVNEALRWRAVLAEAPTDDERETLELLTTEEAERLEATKGPRGAKRFADIALGQATLSELHFDPWVAQLTLEAKTVDQMRTDVRRMLARFPVLEEITAASVARWFDELSGTGVSPSSLARIATFCRNYWGYLQRHHVVPRGANPFAGLSGNAKRNKKNGRRNGGGWEPLTPKDVVKLWTEARSREDEQLSDLILLAAYSGARIEELCSLKTSSVTASTFKVVDAKTAAGVREVPIHSKIRSTVKRLVRDSEDGYLVSGLTPNKYGDRSNAIGKRFGRLKSSLGFGESQVFHSIRKTFITLLENAGVSENLAADIVGHEKPRITYGLYSGGSGLKQKARAVELVRYPAK